MVSLSLLRSSCTYIPLSPCGLASSFVLCLYDILQSTYGLASVVAWVVFLIHYVVVVLHSRCCPSLVMMSLGPLSCPCYFPPLLCGAVLGAVPERLPQDALTVRFRARIILSRLGPITLVVYR